MGNDDIVPGFDAIAGTGVQVGLGRIEELEGGLLLRVEGLMSSPAAERFMVQVGLAIEVGFIRLVLDLSGLKYDGSPGLGSLIAIYKRLRERGGDMALCSVPPPVFEIFQLLGFSQFFKVTDTPAQAIAALKEPDPIPGPVNFPYAFACPICDRRWRVAKPGRATCAECKTALSISAKGEVFLA